MTPDALQRFVILHHAAPAGEHWDLMLETGDRLATWQLLSAPTGAAACPIECVRIGEHRKLYLDYEGPISRGRGEVRRVDQGTYTLRSRADDEWIVTLHGETLIGEFRLRHTGDGERWVLAKH
ncbi:MAG: hypothetical protein HOP29_01545 [Phycisphaerales bacterium]|nr:hypothetical protein [Phycisphaerales bacterium]